LSQTAPEQGHIERASQIVETVASQEIRDADHDQDSNPWGDRQETCGHRQAEECKDIVCQKEAQFERSVKFESAQGEVLPGVLSLLRCHHEEQGVIVGVVIRRYLNRWFIVILSSSAIVPWVTLSFE
jgi:hypothetical protein